MSTKTAYIPFKVKDISLADWGRKEIKLAEAEMEYEKAKRKAEIVDASRSNIERLKQQADFRYQTENLAQAKQKLAHHKKAVLLNEKVSLGKIKIMQSRVNRIKDEIVKLSVKAPKDGLVMYQENDQGEKVAVGETVYMGRSLMQLPSLDAIALKAEFAEPDKSKVKLGQAVRVIFEAYPVPATDNLTVKLNLPEAEQFDVVLYAIDGKEMQRTSYHQQALQTTIQTGQLARGLYILSLEGASGSKQIKIPLVE